MKMRSDLLFSDACGGCDLRRLGTGVPPTAALPEASLEGIDPLLQGRQETFSDCMGYWKPATPMSKSEWRQACHRTLNGTDLVPPRSGAKGN